MQLIVTFATFTKLLDGVHADYEPLAAMSSCKALDLPRKILKRGV
jgi:hypothetical protein